MNCYILGDLWEPYHDRILIIQLEEAKKAFEQRGIYPFIKHRCNYINKSLTDWTPDYLEIDFRSRNDLNDLSVIKLKQERSWHNMGSHENGNYEIELLPQECILFHWYKYWKREDLYRFIRQGLKDLAWSLCHNGSSQEYNGDMLEMILNLKRISKWELIFMATEIDNCGGQSVWDIAPPEYNEDELKTKIIQKLVRDSQPV